MNSTYYEVWILGGYIWEYIITCTTRREAEMYKEFLEVVGIESRVMEFNRKEQNETVGV